MIWVNFKIYSETFGKKVLKLAESCRRVSQKTKISIIPVVSPFDLWRIKKEVGGEVWVQHIDPFFEGKRTGWLSPLQAVTLGGGGALLNHSEHKLPPGKIRQILAYLKKDKWIDYWQEKLGRKKLAAEIKNFKILVCFRSRGQAIKWVRKLKPRPDFVAYEPPELIGGKISVSQAHPQLIKNMVKLLPQYPLVVGAGIKTAVDVRRALKMGAKGILVSSAIIKAQKPEEKLKELAEGFK